MADQFRLALERTAVSMEGRLKTRALEMGWPQDLAMSLTLRVNEDGDILPQWPKEREDEVLAWEGGMPDRLPAPAIFSFFNSPQDTKDTQDHALVEMNGIIAELSRRVFG